MTEPAVKTGGGVRSLLAAGWGAVTGIAPHVLHHVGPLAGAALLAGAGGQLAFFAVGLVATVPTLRRLHRRFDNWVAPGLALGVFSVAFDVSWENTPWVHTLFLDTKLNQGRIGSSSERYPDFAPRRT